MQYPKWVVLQVTDRCNLRCKMCYEWGENGSNLSKRHLNNLDLNKIEEIFMELQNKNVYFELFGGEPLMHPQISEILKLIKKYNCIIDIPTNGTLVSKYAKEIVDANIKRIWISIDGPQEQNDLQRGKGVYQRAYEGIKALQKERAINKKGPQIGVTMVITPLNYKYVKEFVMN